MPCSARSAACLASSVNLELPPSITRSPSESTPARSVITPVVICPDGTITQTMRGAGMAAARASRSATSVTSGFGSYPVTSMPAARNRVRMLLPIRPSPTSPMCMDAPLRAKRGRFSAQQQVRLQQVLVVVGSGRLARGLARDEHGTRLVRILGLRERDAHELAVHGPQAIEQERRLERDDGVIPHEMRVDRLGCLSLFRPRGLEGETLGRREAEPQRGLALEHERHATG